MKIRYVLTALVLLWLVVSLIYLSPFFLASKEKPPVVSSYTPSPPRFHTKHSLTLSVLRLAVDVVAIFVSLVNYRSSWHTKPVNGLSQKCY